MSDIMRRYEEKKKAMREKTMKARVCQHKRLDIKGEIKTMSPPIMRCVECKEWVVARGYCEECGRRDAVEWMDVQTSPALSPDEFVRATYKEGITAMQRETCRHCGHVQGMTRLV